MLREAVVRSALEFSCFYREERHARRGDQTKNFVCPAIAIQDPLTIPLMS